MKKTSLLLLSLLVLSANAPAQEKVFPGADEKTPSRAQFFTWINNTNEGATAEQTLINLEFFGWMKREYGMQLDIYAFDAGATIFRCSGGDGVRGDKRGKAFGQKVEAGLTDTHVGLNSTKQQLLYSLLPQGGNEGLHSRRAEVQFFSR